MGIKLHRGFESRPLRIALMTREKRLVLVLAVNLAMVLSLLLVGLLARSLGVLASGADYLGDALGTGLSLWALRMTRQNRGHPSATSFAALANSSLLAFVTPALAAEAIRRLSSGAPSVDGLPVVGQRPLLARLGGGSRDRRGGRLSRRQAHAQGAKTHAKQPR